MLLSVAAIITVAASAIGFGIFNAVMLRPLALPASDALVSIVNLNPSGRQYLVSAEEWRSARERSGWFDEVAAMRPKRFLARTDHTAKVVSAREVSSNYFDTLGVAASAGRAFAQRDRSEQRFVVLSSHLSKDLFGNPDRSVQHIVNLDRVPYTVIGVMPSQFKDAQDLMLDPDSNVVWVLNAFESTSKNIAAHELNIVARLKHGVSIHDASAATAPLSAIALRSTLLGQRGHGVWSVFAIACLLAACCSGAALLLICLTERGRAPRGKQAALLALLSGSCGLVLAAAGLRLLRSSGQAAIPRFDEIGVDWRVILFTAAIAVVCVASITITSFFGERSRSRFSSLVKAGLGVGIAATLALATCGGMALRMQSRNLRAVLGFDPGSLTTIDVDYPARAESPGVLSTAERFALSLAVDPNVEVALASNPLLRGGTFLRMEAGAQGGAIPAFAECQFVDRSYFDVLRIPVLQGRAFAASDSAASQPIAIVSQAFAIRYLNGNALGQYVRLASGTLSPPSEIVGVVGDVRDIKLSRPPAPEVYFHYSTSSIPLNLLVRTRGDQSAVLSDARAKLAAIDRDAVVSDIRPVMQTISDSRKLSTLVAELLGMLTIPAVLLLFASVQAMCSSVGGVSNALRRLPSVFAGRARVVLVGLAAGSMLSLLVQRELAHSVEGFEAMDWVTYALVLCLTLAILAACAHISMLRLPSRSRI